MSAFTKNDFAPMKEPLVEIAEAVLHPSACDHMVCIGKAHGVRCAQQLFVANMRAWQTARALGKGWKPRVHQNLGWFAGAISKDEKLAVSMSQYSYATDSRTPVRSYQVTAWPQPYCIGGSAPTAKGALRNALRTLKKTADDAATTLFKAQLSVAVSR